MDNRTERQKFDDRFPLEEGMTITNPEYYKLYQDSRFEVWLAAKHDAKPVAEFYYRRWKDGGEEWFLLDGSSIGRRFKTKIEGEEWAVANGYRLE